MVIGQTDTGIFTWYINGRHANFNFHLNKHILPMFFLIWASIFDNDKARD